MTPTALPTRLDPAALAPTLFRKYLDFALVQLHLDAAAVDAKDPQPRLSLVASPCGALRADRDAVAVLARQAEPDRITAAPTDETTSDTAGASTVPGPTAP